MKGLDGIVGQRPIHRFALFIVDFIAAVFDFEFFSEKIGIACVY